MSVTIQKEILAFYDYCLCVPPLKTEWGELSVWLFWLCVSGAGFQNEGIHRHFPLMNAVEWSTAKTHRPVSYRATARVKWNLKNRLPLEQKKTKKKHVCRFLLRQQRLEALRSDLLSCTFNVYRFSQGRSVKWMVLDRCTFLWENNGSLWNCTANLQILKKSNVLYCLFLYMKSIYFHFIWSKDERKWKRKWLITNLNPQETDQK